MIDPKEVSVLVPAFNEEEGIAPVVTGLRALGAWREVIVIDDGSTDATAERAHGAGARVVRHPYNKGNGAAVKTGLREAAGDFVLLLDADGQHRPEDIPGLLERLEDHDMVIGARAARDQGRVRALGNAVFKLLASWLTGRPIQDLTSGFRAGSPCSRSCPCFPTDSRIRRPPALRFSRRD
jgi:glycosyltransferase involved in cell wall biosynthesis